MLAEFYAAATSKRKLDMTHGDAVVLLKSLERIPACPITRELAIEAVVIRQRYQISYWDAAIIAAARQMECAAVYSEDLNAGQDYDCVKVVNPFDAAAAP